jgi:cysteine synthase A
MNDDILKSVGKTPHLALKRLAPAGGAQLIAKLESWNPGHSVKDRIALSIINAAEQAGKLQPGGAIVEATSGNTGIGLALIGAVRGYRVILTLPDNASVERIRLLRMLGAEVRMTPVSDGMAGALYLAEELAAEHRNYFYADQFHNPANPQAHRETTAREILEATGGRVEAFVAGVGTGGTLTGVGEVLKAHNPDIRIVAVEPSGAPVLSGGKPGIHKIQGIGAGFIPRVLNREIIDRIITVTDQDAFDMQRELACTEGLLVGISSGAAAWAACQVAAELSAGSTVVTILPDTGDRYLSQLHNVRS